MSERTAPSTQKGQSKDTDKGQTSKDNADDQKFVEVKHVLNLQVKVGETKVRIAYRETKCDDGKLHVLFLHGQSFKSETWATEPMQTLQLLYKTGGFRAVAIDLPGYGDSPKAEVDQVAFIEAVIAALELEAPVIVCTSMSGSFILPYLFKDPENVLTRARGFVAVAPVMTENYNAEQYQKLTIPTLVIYGDRDKRIGAIAKKNLENLPDRTIKEVPDAGHACYMNNPKEFHKSFIEFLESLKK